MICVSRIAFPYHLFQPSLNHAEIMRFTRLTRQTTIAKLAMRHAKQSRQVFQIKGVRTRLVAQGA